MAANDHQLDVAGYSEEAENAVERVRESEEITDAERAAITRFLTHRKGKDRKPATITNDATTLRMTAERAGEGEPAGADEVVDYTATELTRWGLAEYDAYSTWMKDEREYAGKTRASYQRALRLFFEFLHNNDQYDDFGWWRQIEITQDGNEPTYDPDELLDEQDLADMKRDLSVRDSALAEFMVATGLRVTAALSMKVRDVQPQAEPECGYFSVPEDAEGMKGMHGESVVFTRGRAELVRYLQHDHPDPDNDDAPLFPKERGYDPAQPHGENVPTPGTVGDNFNAAGEGIDKPTNPHMMRHFCASRLLDRGFSVDSLADRMGWSPSVAQRMAARYDQRSREQKNRKAKEELGIGDPDDPESEVGALGSAQEAQQNRTAPAYCPHCDYGLPPHANACPQCTRDPHETPDAHERAERERMGTEEARRVLAEEMGVSEDALATFMDAATEGGPDAEADAPPSGQSAHPTAD